MGVLDSVKGLAHGIPGRAHFVPPRPPSGPSRIARRAKTGRSRGGKAGSPPQLIAARARAAH